MPASWDPAKGKGSDADSVSSAPSPPCQEIGGVEKRWNGVELNQRRVPSVNNVAKRSEGPLLSRGMLAVWESAEQQG